MVTRQPQLLSASRHQLLSRLMAMRLASSAAGVDVVRVVQAQPSLLVLDEAHPLADWARLDTEELAELIKGWEHGVASDTDPEWHARAAQLRAYHRQHGDTSVGFRDGDDPELARWANKQRRELVAGSLPEPKAELLRELGFEADEQEAEWLRWFLDLARFREAHGHASPMSLSAGADLYLINWCSVQRVAHSALRAGGAAGGSNGPPPGVDSNEWRHCKHSMQARQGQQAQPASTNKDSRLSMEARQGEQAPHGSPRGTSRCCRMSRCRVQVQGAESAPAGPAREHRLRLGWRRPAVMSGCLRHSQGGAAHPSQQPAQRRGAFAGAAAPSACMGCSLNAPAAASAAQSRRFTKGRNPGLFLVKASQGLAVLG
ncbi:hypothetical protein COO60DRAFT_692327 [Scenedesmus sp. NREL 46B-D3]|nr:hypothetical protein COO60DRAFT_692327 [Scenedesmus sp. NREL 46B-D3]